MRDEELAEQFADKECCETCPNIFRTCKEKCECWEFAKKGFLAGLKAGSQLDEVWHDYDAGEDCYEDSHEGRWVKRETGPQWHDLRKNPNDLPKEKVDVYVLCSWGEVDVMHLEWNKEWFNDYGEHCSLTFVTHWKEIVLPKGIR